MRDTTVIVNCARCKIEFAARVADRKRGWGRFCSKSCKAVKQEQRTGQYGNYRNSGVDRETYNRDQRKHGGIPQYNNRGEYEGFCMSPGDLTGGGYGDADWNTPFHDGKD